MVSYRIINRITTLAMVKVFKFSSKSLDLRISTREDKIFLNHML